ncbi:hypothetical protein SAMD00019534_125670 [Acytostelium subglobosum LB1]|uniref:hypothetical protein n=1 Tax=Acytostelium subglobosum LB1 TaxID=1410327 RepID=UPI0006448A91|nr:hypothetical protein SAMD00019534_125670 [Acytostelium subglobosum LB1]GAM29391.1 hypothetical protein SAMD00019534_125670 [Acytostelium subglobosum LB1]|eukprot:XP_012747659.1 hypothetical protein SAMD00019534_125670 [Acytostelium subglobosum LB1]
MDMDTNHTLPPPYVVLSKPTQYRAEPRTRKTVELVKHDSPVYVLVSTDHEPADERYRVIMHRKIEMKNRQNRTINPQPLDAEVIDVDAPEEAELVPLLPPPQPREFTINVKINKGFDRRFYCESMYESICVDF